MAEQKDDHCGKDLRKFLYVAGAAAVFILIGSYWYTYFYQQGLNIGFFTSDTTPGPATLARGANFIPAAAARPITIAASPFRAVAASIKPSVVNISATRSSAAFRQAAAQTKDSLRGLKFADPFSGVGVESIGSGVIVTQDGYILTNYHVVERATEVYVTVFHPQGTSRHIAEIVRMSEPIDLALLKIEPETPIMPASLGDSERLQVGDQILAIGSPFGLDQTVSQGIVSSKRKSILIEGINHRNLLQTDAAINQGNSGGPLVDIDGYVVGINTAIYTPTGAFAGVGFAVPVNDVREFLEEVITLPNAKPNLKAALKWQARARQAASVVPTAEMAPSIRAGAPSPHDDRGPCVNCHHILSAFSGNQTMTQAPGTMQFSMNPGGAVGMNAAMTAAVAPTKLGLKRSWFGAEVQKIDRVVARSFKSPIVNGVFVNSVYAGSPAEAAGLKPGDIIFKIDGRWFYTPEDLLRLVSSYDSGDTVRVSIFRNGSRRNLYLDFVEPPSAIAPALGVSPGAAPRANAGTQPMFWGNAEAPTRLQSGTAPPPIPKEFTWVGMELESLSLNEAAGDPGFIGKKGALVLEIDPVSPAAMAGIRSGDLILSINQAAVDTQEALNRVIWMSQKTNGSLIEIDRNNHRMFVTIR